MNGVPSFLYFVDVQARNSITGLGGNVTQSVVEMHSTSQKRIDIDSVKRNAPLIHSSQARSEICQIVSQRVSCTLYLFHSLLICI